METIHGRLWESGDVDDLNLYHKIRKAEPMTRALNDLGTTAWLSGLRREQTKHRRDLSHFNLDGGRYKVLPILDWTSKDEYEYVESHQLPQHPLFDAGYVSVGDWHSSRPITAHDLHERDTRFGGMKQECGTLLQNSIITDLAAAAA